VRGALSLAAFGTAFWRTENLAAAACALVLTWTVVFLSYDIWRARSVLDAGEHFFIFRRAQLRTLLVLSAPLGVLMTLISFNVNIPRYLLVRFLGDADLGIFASLAYVLVAMTLLAHALGQAASARLARMFATQQLAAFRAVTVKLLLVGAAILVAGPVGAFLFGHPLLNAFYGPEYAEHVGLFTLMAVTAGLHCIGTFLIYAVTAARVFRVQAVVKVVAIIVTLILSLLLIPRWGLVGAANALLASEAAFVIAMARVLALTIRKGTEL
jgi:O-antigen/teichoic acid export membrane protein